MPVRAAALGLLALGALIAAVLIFGGGDDRPTGAGESSTAAPTSATQGSTAPVTTSGSTAESPTSVPTTTTAQSPQDTSIPTDATVGQTEALPPAGVTVLITSQSWNAATGSIEVVGAVQGVATETSTCTAIASMDQTKVEASVGGTFDGQGTSCGLITIPMTGQPRGSYQVVITFDAGNGAATSDPVTVTVA